jgi:hypothetical protein
MTDSQYLENVWGEILSRRPVRIQRMFASLDASSQQEVLQHLQRMTTDDGWQEVQVASAEFALKTIDPSSLIKHA